MEADMNKAERFAINEWLSDYPEDKTFDEIMDLIREDDESVTAWELVEHHPAADLIEIIYNTKMHFEFVTKPTTEEAKP
jgi:hypothetical protein